MAVGYTRCNELGRDDDSVQPDQNQLGNQPTGEEFIDALTLQVGELTRIVEMFATKVATM